MYGLCGAGYFFMALHKQVHIKESKPHHLHNVTVISTMQSINHVYPVLFWLIEDKEKMICLR